MRLRSKFFRFGLATTVVGAALLPSIAFAWDCVPGVQDSLEAQQAGLCVPVGQPLPTPTPVPPPPVQPTPEPTPIATPAPPPPVAVVLPPGAGSRPPGEVCHFEPSTGAWSTRVHYGDVLQGTDEWLPVGSNVCDQHNPAPPTWIIPPLPTPPAIEIAPPVATPAPTPVPAPRTLPAPPVVTTPVPVPTRTPEPEIEVPVAPPNAGLDGTAAEEVVD